MITIDECIAAFKQNNAKAKIVSCKDWGDHYLFTIYESPEDIDPFYLVNKETGSVEHYTIAEDPSKYYSTKELLER